MTLQFGRKPVEKEDQYLKKYNMSMVHCRECGEKISDSAKACPKCGATQKVKSNNSTLLWILLLLLLLGGGGVYLFKDTLFSGSDDQTNKIKIPNGSYTLVKDNDKGLTKVLHVIEQAKVATKGLGNQLVVIGDSIQASDLFTNIMGGPTKFEIKKAAGDNMFTLELPGNSLSMELTSQQRLRIYVGSDSLIYQKN